MNAQFGDYGKFYSIAGFLSRPNETIVRKVKKKIKGLYDEVSKSEVESWEDSYEVLAKAFSQLPDDFGGLWVILEYVMPSTRPGGRRFNNGETIRADAIILSTDKVLVLEFKRYNGEKLSKVKKHVKKTSLYGRQISRYHDESADMDVRCLLVESWATSLQMTMDGVHVCSPDKLAEEILSFMGESPKAHLFPKQWAKSKYSIRESENS